MTNRFVFTGIYGFLGAIGAFLALQASEQYLTSAQFLAQLLRQVMSRPQLKHGLLGSAALLPLKPIFKPSVSPISTQCVVVVVGVCAVIAPA